MTRELTGKTPDPDAAFASLQGLYRTHAEEEMDKPMEERSGTELLVVVRRDMRHLMKAEIDFVPTLYHLRDKQSTVVENYAVTGIGADLARAVFDARHFRVDRCLEAMMLVVDGIRRIKASVPGSGGSTNVIAITGETKWFEHELGKEETKQIEADCEFLDERLRYLYQWLPQSRKHDNLEKNLDILKKQILTHRNARTTLVSF
jgi:hypothetical protein